MERMDEAVASRDGSSRPAVDALCGQKLIAPCKPLTTFLYFFYGGVQASCDCGRREFYSRHTCSFQQKLLLWAYPRKLMFDDLGAIRRLLKLNVLWGHGERPL